MGEFIYLLIPEQHKNGILHAHLVATNTQTKKWWKDSAFHAGLGYIVDVKPMANAGSVPGYISKYISKGLVVPCWPKGFRRARNSQDWPKLPDLEDAREIDYQVYRNANVLEARLDILVDLGFDVTLSCELET